MVKRKIALDTNIVIEVLKNNAVEIGKLKEFDSVFLPVTVCGELYFGAINATSTKHLVKYYEYLKDVTILPITESVAEVYGQVRLSLHKKGKPIPENDIWIAAICIENNIPLFSNDKHFKNINTLKLIS